jgi:glucans biosynthesis protein C
MRPIRSGNLNHPQQKRLHYLDWLRVLAVLGVFCAHIIYVFDTFYWHMRTAQGTPGVETFVAFGTQWGMSLLFLLSGASSWFALHSRTAAQFLGERFTRLLIPFLVAFVLLAPLQAYVEALIQSRHPGPFFQYFLAFFANMQISWNPQWLAAYGHHLWFLAFLFLISALALPLLVYLKREQGERLVQRLAALSVRRGGLLVFVLPLVLIQVMLRAPFPGYQSWADFFSWLACFVYGYILLSDPRFAQAIKNQGTIALVVGSACYLLSMVWDAGGPFTGWYFLNWAAIPGSLAAYLLYQILWSMATWSWLIFILFFGMRLLNTDNKVIHYGNEAVLPFYVLHYPVILLTTFYIAQLPMGVVAKLLLVATCSLLVILAQYELLIRRINALRFLFGMKPRTRVVHGDVDLQEHTP